MISKSHVGMLVAVSFCVSLACDFAPPKIGRDGIDWKAEWAKNHIQLKALADDLLANGNSKYVLGNNDFPDQFSYPFDEGFSIRSIDSSFRKGSISVKFYLDRGLLDHYSAFVYATDPVVINELERMVSDGGNDFRLEPNWYIINE